VYRVYFSDGRPLWPRAGEDPAVPVALPDDPDRAGADVVYRIASWEESELTGRGLEQPLIAAQTRRLTKLHRARNVRY
jgi:hypothetical protein